MTIITYKTEFSEHTVEIGHRFGVEREGACLDMCISRTLDPLCPIKVAMLLRTNGALDVWYVEFVGGCNPYWHFDHGSQDHVDRPITEAQLQTMIRLRDNIDIYGNLGGSLGADVIRWAFGEKAERIARGYISKKRASAPGLKARLAS